MRELLKSSKVLKTLAIPFVFAAVLFTVCASNGRTLLGDQHSLASFFSYTAVIMLTTFALSINLGSGRFDFSLGSVAALSAIISAKITYTMLSGGGNSALVMFLLCIMIGAVLGAFSGVIYVLLKLPPIITSLGVALIFEGIAFALTGGAYMMREVRNVSMAAFSNSRVYPLLIIAATLAIIYYIYDRTEFGYNYKALREGQKVSVTTGIREIPNAVMCSLICGALMGIVGFLQAARSTLINGNVLNFGSIGIMFAAFLPMFMGGFIGRFSNDKLGYLLAAAAMSLLNSAFTLFYDIINTSAKSIIEAVLLVLFLIYLNNRNHIRRKAI